jgi:hypothetical protein
MPNPFLKAGGGTLGLLTLFKAAFRLKATRGRVRIPQSLPSGGLGSWRASRKPASRFPLILHEVLSECDASSHRFSTLRHRELLLGAQTD